MWLCEESSTMVNDKAWNLTIKGTPSLNQKINTLQTLSQTLENLEKEAQLYLELEELLKREEIMWKEKSKQR